MNADSVPLAVGASGSDDWAGRGPAPRGVRKEQLVDHPDDDAMVTSQAEFIIDTAMAKKLPTMFAVSSLVAKGALATYGVSYREVGRLSAKYVQRILTGTGPQNLPVELLSKVELAVNLKTAREIGVTIPQAVRLRADEVIQ